MNTHNLLTEADLHVNICCSLTRQWSSWRFLSYFHFLRAKGASGIVAKSALKKPNSAKKSGKRKAVAVKKTHRPASKSLPAKLRKKPAVVKNKKPVVAKKKTPAVAKAVKTRPAKMAVSSSHRSNGKMAKPTADISKVNKSRIDKRGKLAVPAPAVITPPVVTEVATDQKPRKNQAGLLSRELEHFRDLLLEKRREIVGDMSSMEREALRSGGSNLSTLPMHMADMGTDNYEQEFTLGLVEKDRNLLRDLNRALAKIQNGTFGICEGTGKPIAKARLEVQPWARFSIEYARQLEKGGMGVR
jgi:DnaK suppressor protein